MTTKSYELVVHSNRNLLFLYEFIGGFVSTHYDMSDSEGGYSSADWAMAQYTDDENHPYYHWWKDNIQFKGSANTKPFELVSSGASFHDKNFPDIIFTAHETDDFVRATIKNEFFKKFNTVVDDIDGSTLIEEVKMLIDSNVFTEHLTQQYCNDVIKEYEMFEKMFSSYVVEKVAVPVQLNNKNTLVFYLKGEPSKEIVENIIARIQYFIDNYADLMILTDMDTYSFFPATIEEGIEEPDGFKVLLVELFEHVTTTTIKRVL